jgi:flagellar biosynthesis protein FlhF
MSVKRFVAADMRRALELVRREMGDDAIILSSRRIKQGVEILTQVEPVAATPNPSPLDNQGGESDVAMPSDGAWAEQRQLEAAVARHQGAVSQAPTQHPEQVAASNAAPHIIKAKTTSRGLASGKTPAELAEEIEQARQRMMAAKRAQSESTTNSFDSTMADTQSHAGRSSEADIQTTEFQSTRSAREHSFSDTSASEAQSLQAQRDQQTRRDQQAQRDQLASLQAELADMRILLEDQLSRIAKTPSQAPSPLHASLQRRLDRLGLSVDNQQLLLDKVNMHGGLREAWKESLAVLSHQIPTLGQDLVAKGGVFAFVGPTGVGKTTTITKLAARYVLEHGADKVALVTTDTYRIAAHDQLRSLGQILNVQVKVVDDNEDLPAVLRSLKGCELVLIDTAGLRHGDPLLKQQLQMLNQLPQVTSLLVMAANSQRQMLTATLHAYQKAGLAGCILTKLDETASLGEAIDVILDKRLPLAYTTDGQEIPDDLELARGHRLVAQAITLLKQQSGEASSFDSLLAGANGGLNGHPQGVGSIYTEQR